MTFVARLSSTLTSGVYPLLTKKTYASYILFESRTRICVAKMVFALRLYIIWRNRHFHPRTRTGHGREFPHAIDVNDPCIFLLANAQKQKILVINLSSMLVMRLEDQALLLLPLFLSRIRMDNGWWWMGMGTERDGIVSCAIFLGLIVVLLRPFCCLFKCPFDVTRLGLRYLNVKR